MEDYDLLRVYRKGKPVAIQYLKLPGNSKYGFMPEDKVVNVLGKQYVVRQLIALSSFENVKAGDLGGWISSSDNLDWNDNSWIEDSAIVVGSSIVTGNSYIENLYVIDSMISDESELSGHDDEDYIVDSKVFSSLIENVNRIQHSEVVGCELNFTSKTVVERSILSKIVMLSDGYKNTVLSIDSCILKNIIASGSICLRDVDILLSKHDSENTDDKFIMDGDYGYDGGKLEIVMSRTFNKSKKFTWNDLLAINENEDTNKVEDVIAAAVKLNSEGISGGVDSAAAYNSSKSAKGDIEDLLAGMFGK